MSITIKRVYEEPEHKDGMKILVDRLWPRGMAKSETKIDVWMKDIAPSDELRHWYNHDSQKWPEFKKRYFAELDKNADTVSEMIGYIKSGNVVFLFGSKETRYNNAVALKEYIESILE